MRTPYDHHLNLAINMANDLADRSRYDEAAVHALVAVALSLDGLRADVRALGTELFGMRSDLPGPPRAG